MASNEQKSQVTPPSPSDLQAGLTDYSATIQNNLADLFQSAHSHEVLSGVPIDTDSIAGTISLVDDGTNQYLYVKFASGWKRFVSA
jgi:hypothetical protein